MNTLKIKSVTQSDKICYVIDHEYQYCPSFRLGDRVKQYDTFGDGDCQHSPAYFSPAGNAYDFLVSLLAVLGNDSDCDKETIEFIRWEIGYGLEVMNLETAKFLSSVMYNPEKQNRYYSIEEKRISSTESKRYDKRWFKIPDWANGKPDSIVGLWNNAHSGPCGNLLGIMGLWFKAVEALDCASYFFSECKPIAEAFGNKLDDAYRLFKLVVELINTRSNLLWQNSRVQSLLDEVKNKSEVQQSATTQQAA